LKEQEALEDERLLANVTENTGYTIGSDEGRLLVSDSFHLLINRPLLKIKRQLLPWYTHLRENPFPPHWSPKIFARSLLCVNKFRGFRRRGSDTTGVDADYCVWKSSIFQALGVFQKEIQLSTQVDFNDY